MWIKILISLLCVNYIYANDSSFETFKSKSLITDPVISRRCKALIKDRQNKIQIRQKINSLILRNQKLFDETQDNRKLAKHKLELNKTQLKNNLRLTNIRIQAMEENIVRKGCPGITL